MINRRCTAPRERRPPVVSPSEADPSFHHPGLPQLAPPWLCGSAVHSQFPYYMSGLRWWTTEPRALGIGFQTALLWLRITVVPFVGSRQVEVSRTRMINRRCTAPRERRPPVFSPSEADPSFHHPRLTRLFTIPAAPAGPAVVVRFSSTLAVSLLCERTSVGGTEPRADRLDSRLAQGPARCFSERCNPRE